MSNEPKCTDALQAEIAQQYRNINSKPGLEIGLRPELGTYELCDKHYDASRTEAAEHCAVCQLQAQLAALREGITAHRNGTKMRAGSLWNATLEDAALWALLQGEKG